MEKFKLTSKDGMDVACYAWPVSEPRGSVVIAHGMGEHAQRYDWVARELNAAGYAVYAKDHRGHGDTAHAKLGDMGEDGWNRTLDDIHLLVQDARTRCPGVPLILLGHSMGSMLSQQYVTTFGQSIDALVLSGSPGIKASIGGLILRVLAGREVKRLGPGEHSEKLQERLFGNANKPFDGPQANGYEWLSRDTSEVQKYIDDDGCGFVLSCGSLVDMSHGTSFARSSEALSNIPKHLPVYIFSGDEDPVHGAKKDIYRLIKLWTKHGVQSPKLKWYEGGRHEMFNEVNRNEVVGDLIGWLDSVAHES